MDALFSAFQGPGPMQASPLIAVGLVVIPAHKEIRHARH